MSQADQLFMKHAVEIALDAEAQGNAPVGAVIVLQGEAIASGTNKMWHPKFHPGLHAEQVALSNVPEHLWPQVHEMTCYSTLEPCVMCMGSLWVYEFKRVVYGAADPLGGGRCLSEHLPPYFQQIPAMELEGPLMPQVCDPLAQRTMSRFSSN